MLYNYFKKDKMDNERNFPFLGAIETKKFYINESKKHIQSSATLEFRANPQKILTEITFSHSFLSETLITNVQIVSYNGLAFQSFYDNVEVEVSSLANRGHFYQLINSKVVKQGQTVTFSGFGFTHNVKVIFILKTELKKKSGKQKEIYESAEKLITQSVREINLFGVCINSNPASVMLTKLLNISESFKKYNMLQESAETDILVGLSLINARRFVLSAEILRKVSKFYVEKYNSTKLNVDLNRTQRSSVFKQLEEDGNQVSTTKSNFGTGRILQSNKFLQKAAKVEILIAQTISHPSLVLQKLEAYHKCNCFASSIPNPASLGPNADLQQTTIVMFPQLAIFLLKMLSDKLEPIRIASLKSIEFFIETLGCSIGSTFLQILKEVISTYPYNQSVEGNSNRVPLGLQQVEILQKKENIEQRQFGTSSIKNKILTDHYHHLLETLLSLLGQINRKIVISIFSEIILPSLLSKTASSQLKLYLLRFCQKSISISGADLKIQMSFVGLLLSFCQQKNSTKQMMNSSGNKNTDRYSKGVKQQISQINHNKHVLHNLIYLSHKILGAIKMKVLPRYSGNKMQDLLEWINKTLIYLGQNEMLSNSNSQHSIFVFTTILDFIISIYSSFRYDSTRLLFSPLETILYFTNISINTQQSGISFDKILQALSTTLKYHSMNDQSFELDTEIIQRILQKSRQYNLSLKQLQTLYKVLQIAEERNQMLNWLESYLGCIPHSTFDETYHVFSILLRKSMKYYSSSPMKKDLLNRIVKTMLDQYTVKGKAHQQAKIALINSMISNDSHNIVDLIEICLFSNTEPKLQNYESRKKLRKIENKSKPGHLFDSKGYKIDFELFMQKISFGQLILATIKGDKECSLAITKEDFINRFFQFIRTLIESSSMKLRSKSLSLVNHYLEVITHSWREKEFNLFSFFLIAKNLFAISKALFVKLKDSKLFYSAIFNIITLYRCLEKEDSDFKYRSEHGIEKICQKSQEVLKEESKMKVSFSKSEGHSIIHLYILRQFLKIWPNLNQALYSPWENVRQIYTLLLIEVFKEGLGIIPDHLKKKAIDLSRPLLSNFFKSNEQNQRRSALKIFGCLLGLAAKYEDKNMLSLIVSENLKYIRGFIERVHEATYDWQEKTIQIAENLCEFCMSEETRQIFNDRKKQLYKKNQFDVENSAISFNIQQEIISQRKNFSMFGFNNLESQLKESWFDDELVMTEEGYYPVITDQMLNRAQQFKNLIQKQTQAKTEVFAEKQSFLQQNEEEQYYDIGQQRAQSNEEKEKSEDDQLQFEDLGIIELDDEEWGEEDEKQEKSEKSLQKLPLLKKQFKLSPNIINSWKPQRIRSKRFHQNQFEYREKIIVDELEQKISSNNVYSSLSNELKNKNVVSNQAEWTQAKSQENERGVNKDKQKQKQKQKQNQKQREDLNSNRQRYREDTNINRKRQKKQERQKVEEYKKDFQPIIIDDFESHRQYVDQLPTSITKRRASGQNDKKERQPRRQKEVAQKDTARNIVQNEKQPEKKKKGSTRKRKSSYGK